MSVKVTDNTNKVLDALDNAIDRALKAIGQTAERYAKQKAKEQGVVDTGLLRNSITYAVSGESPPIKEYEADKENEKGEKEKGKYEGQMPEEKEKSVYLGTNVKYAVHNEYGTSKMPPRPFLRPAATEHSEEYKKLMKESMENA